MTCRNMVMEKNRIGKCTSKDVEKTGESEGKNTKRNN